MNKKKSIIILSICLMFNLLNAQTTVLEADYPAAYDLTKVAEGGKLSQISVDTDIDSVVIESVKDLALAAAGTNRFVSMKPGVYQMEDYLTPSVISAIEPDALGRHAMITFSGNNNTFDLSGVTIEVNTELLNDFGTSVVELQVTGNNIIIKGLILTDIGNAPTAKGGQSVAIEGDNVRMEDVTLNVSGSYPYGYGDLLGKGGGSLTAMKKHSGMLISGINDTIVGCKIYSKAFGHLFFIQGGRNAYFENCYAEAVTRKTDSMLAETSGIAFDLDFAAVYKNYDGEKVITPGYTKSLSECGFRTYGSGGVNQHTTGAHSFVNCVAKNCRIGFALTRIDGDVSVENCEATYCEAAYNLNVVNVKSSRGDAVNGPLLYLVGDNSEVELDLIPNVDTTTTLHAIATIAGSNNKVTLNAYQDSIRTDPNVIKLGSTRGGGSNPFSPQGTANATGITLNNNTGMPVELNSKTSNCTVNSNGTVTNNGSNNKIVLK